jgi:hypothetical protein
VAQPQASAAISIARVFAQDTATTNPAVSDTVAVILLADVMLRFEGDVEVKQQLLAASTTGLTFAAGDTVKTTSNDIGELLAAFPSDTSAVNTLQAKPIEPWTVREMLDRYADTGSGAPTARGSSIEAWAWEKVSEGSGTESEKARVYIYPPQNQTRYLTVRNAPYNVVSGTNSVLDLNPRSLRIVARFLAWEMARLHTRDEAFLGQILAPIPKKILEAYFESARKGGFNVNSVQQTGYLNG